MEQYAKNYNYSLEEKGEEESYFNHTEKLCSIKTQGCFVDESSTESRISVPKKAHDVGYIACRYNVRVIYVA